MKLELNKQDAMCALLLKRGWFFERNILSVAGSVAILWQPEQSDMFRKVTCEVHADGHVQGDLTLEGAL